MEGSNQYKDSQNEIMAKIKKAVLLEHCENEEMDKEMLERLMSGD